MEPDRQEDVDTDANDAADEFDESPTGVTQRRELTKDAKKRLKYKGDAREFLEKRLPPIDDDS